MPSKYILITLLLVFTMLFTKACADGTGIMPDATPASGQAAADAAAASTAAAAGLAPGYAAQLPPGLRDDLRGAAITVALGADGPGTPWEEAVIKKFSAATGIQVQRVSVPQSSTERLATYLQQWMAQSGDVDVYAIDVIWPGIVAPYAVDLHEVFASQLDKYFPAIIANNTVEGKLVGIPWYTDAGLLLYRADLLQQYGYTAPPKTWDELEEMAQIIQDGERQAGNNDFWGFVWQGKAFEGLTCNALEWQVSHGGGSIIAPDGTVTVNNAQTIAAFARARRWVGTISPESVTTYNEPESLHTFTEGNAAFMRNWPSSIAVSNAADSAIKGMVGVAQLPRGDEPNARSAATLGGWQLMVSTYSQHQAAAIEFVKYMTSPEIQKSASIERALLPTIAMLYDDSDVRAANPYYADLKPVFIGGAVPRPSTVAGERYKEVSNIYFTSVNEIVTGQTDAKTGVADLEQKLKEIMASRLSQK